MASSQESNASPCVGFRRIGSFRIAASVVSSLINWCRLSCFAADPDLAGIDRQFEFLAGFFRSGVVLDFV